MRIFAILSALVCMAAPALAICRDGIEAPFATKITFDGGTVVEVLERTDDTVRTRTVLSGTSNPTELTMHAGIFMMISQRGQSSVRFEWVDDLPSTDDLSVGATYAENAKVFVNSDYQSALTTTVRVLGAENVVVGGCAYPVLVIHIANVENGQAVVELTRYLHVPSLTTLKSVLRQGTIVRKNVAVTLE